MYKKEMIAMLLAGGQGSRLGVLTSKLQNQQLLLVESTVLLISRLATVLTRESIRLVY